MKQRLKVVKIGGKTAENPADIDAFLESFSKLEFPKILVHGGGIAATKIGEKLGVKPHFIEGRRITDSDTLEVVTMVYGGLINKKIVAKLQALDVNAAGFTGADMNLILSEKRSPVPVDFGQVGDIKTVNSEILTVLLESGIVPVLAPLTHNGKGEILNTNADAIASFTAAALCENFETELMLCFDRAGVFAGEHLVPEINPESCRQLKGEGIITDGMIPKLDLGFAALRKGVERVYITSHTAVHTPESGTELRL